MLPVIGLLIAIGIICSSPEILLFGVGAGAIYAWTVSPGFFVLYIGCWTLLGLFTLLVIKFVDGHEPRFPHTVRSTPSTHFSSSIPTGPIPEVLRVERRIEHELSDLEDRMRFDEMAMARQRERELIRFERNRSLNQERVDRILENFERYR